MPDATVFVAVASLVLQGVMLIFLAGRWKGKQDHSDEALATKIRELNDELDERFKRVERVQSLHGSTLRRHAIDLGVIKARLEER